MTTHAASLIICRASAILIELINIRLSGLQSLPHPTAKHGAANLYQIRHSHSCFPPLFWCPISYAGCCGWRGGCPKRASQLCLFQPTSLALSSFSRALTSDSPGPGCICSGSSQSLAPSPPTTSSGANPTLQRHCVRIRLCYASSESLKYTRQGHALVPVAGPLHIYALGGVLARCTSSDSVQILSSA